ncbi:hypothetical protein K438DRAFT_1289636 [Mycena galopus ATCC 62051]|nr:hypothetical protein K438DRAFT_1289636 [Mycena galopus ATCC 62051]
MPNARRASRALYSPLRPQVQSHLRPRDGAMRIASACAFHFHNTRRLTASQRISSRRGTTPPARPCPMRRTWSPAKPLLPYAQEEGRCGASFSGYGTAAMSRSVSTTNALICQYTHPRVTPPPRRSFHPATTLTPTSMDRTRIRTSTGFADAGLAWLNHLLVSSTGSHSPASPAIRWLLLRSRDPQDRLRRPALHDFCAVSTPGPSGRHIILAIVATYPFGAPRPGRSRQGKSIPIPKTKTGAVVLRRKRAFHRRRS